MDYNLPGLIIVRKTGLVLYTPVVLGASRSVFDVESILVICVGFVLMNGCVVADVSE